MVVMITQIVLVSYGRYSESTVPKSGGPDGTYGTEEASEELGWSGVEELGGSGSSLSIPSSIANASKSKT